MRKASNETYVVILFVRLPVRLLTTLFEIYTLTHFSQCSLFIPPENIRKPEAFWCFQGA